MWPTLHLTAFKSICQWFCFPATFMWCKIRRQSALLIVKVPKETGLCDQRFRPPVYLPWPPVPMNSLPCQALRLISPFDCPTSGRSFVFHPSLLQKASKAHTTVVVSADYLCSDQKDTQMLRLWDVSRRRVKKRGWQCDMTVGGWCLEDMKSIQPKCHPCTISENGNVIKAGYRWSLEQKHTRQDIILQQVKPFYLHLMPTLG